MIHGRSLFGWRLIAAIGLALSALAVQAQNAIESMNVSQQGASVVLKINLKNEPGNSPAGFLVANPPRVALDFPNTINALGRNSQDVGQGELRSINVVQVGDRSRVVLNLKSAVTYDTKVDGKSVLVTISAAASASGPSPTTAATFAESRVADGDPRCAISTSGAAPTVPAGWSSSWPIAIPGLISDSRGRPWWSISRKASCPTICAGASMLEISQLRCKPSTRSSKATMCAW